MRTEASSTPDLAHCQYPALVALSAQLEITALHDALIDALDEAMPGVPVGLYLLDTRQGLWRGVVLIASEAADEMPPEITRLLTGLPDMPPGYAAGQVSADGSVTAFPVYCGRTVLAAVLLGGVHDGPPTPLLGSVLSVYGQQLALLHRSRTDALTGLFNRQSFDDSMTRLFSDAAWSRRRQHDLRGRWCVALLDVDHFKRVNDQFGHLYGDEVLLLIAQLMIRSFRDEDLLFRYGGEEFVVLLADVDQAAAEQVLERFRQSLEDFAFPQVGRVTATIGFSIPDRALPASAILAQADKALYYGKGHGRNQVHGYEQLLALGQLTVCPGGGDDIELF